MIKGYYIPQIRRKGINPLKVYFQQDGAPVHCTAANLQFLEESFPGKVIARKAEFEWPPYSPDLNPCDFFLWGYLKSLVYADPPPATTDELKQAIRREIIKLNRNREMFQNVYRNFLVRVQQLIAKRGGYMENILNY